MKRLLASIFLFFAVSSAVGAAQSNLDSLYAVWQDQSASDTARVFSLIDYINNGPLLTNSGQTFLLADSLADFSRSAGFLKGTVIAYQISGYNAFRTGDYPRALTLYGRGVALADSIGYLFGKADILTKTGFVYHDNDDIISGLAFYKKALDIFITIEDSTGMTSIFNEFGSIYSRRGELEKSLEYFLKSIALNERLGKSEENAAQYSNISYVYADMGEYGQALSYMNKSMVLSRAIDDKLGIGNCFAALGSLYQLQGSIDTAQSYFEQALVSAEEINNILGIVDGLLNLADIAYEKKKYQKVINYVRRSIPLAKDLGDLGALQAFFELLYLINKQLGKTAEALENFEMNNLFLDSLDSEETSMQLQAFEFRKQAVADSLLRVERTREIEVAHLMEVAAQNRNRNYAIGASLFFLVLAGGFYSRWRYVRKSRAIISKEKERSDNLLLNILPAEIAEELMATGKATARDFDLVSVMFTDFKGFTEKSAEIKAVELIDEINVCFQAFDTICEKYQVEKIKTIGDAYMAAGGLPVASEMAAFRTVQAALEMQEFMQRRFAERQQENRFCFEMRLGINTGPVVAGIVGVKKFQYDIWGDTVNTASRVESAGSVGRVNISESTYELLKDRSDLKFEHRGAIEVKGKGAIDMWFVDRVGLSRDP